MKKCLACDGLVPEKHNGICPHCRRNKTYRYTREIISKPLKTTDVVSVSRISRSDQIKENPPKFCTSLILFFFGLASMIADILINFIDSPIALLLSIIITIWGIALVHLTIKSLCKNFRKKSPNNSSKPTSFLKNKKKNFYEQTFKIRTLWTRPIRYSIHNDIWHSKIIKNHNW